MQDYVNSYGYNMIPAKINRPRPICK